jgi:hypothetical protein
MRMTYVVMAILFAAPLLAADSSDGARTFCNGQYALCIKAPCTPIVTRNSDGTYSVDRANCVCDVLTGWSMGPGACDTRTPVTSGGRTYLISSYSNFFNKTNRALSCPSSSQVWATCYGAACAIDEKDPKKATCNCEMKSGAMLTLGGGCRSGACNTIWSAATPSGFTSSNDHYFQYLKQNGLQPPPNPPAKACPTAGQ